MALLTAQQTFNVIKLLRRLFLAGNVWLCQSIRIAMLCV